MPGGKGSFPLNRRQGTTDTAFRPALDQADIAIVRQKSVVWLLLGLVILAWGADAGISAWTWSSRYSACRRLPDLLHETVDVNCVPFLRPTVLWAALAFLLATGGCWAMVRAVRLDRARSASATSETDPWLA